MPSPDDDFVCTAETPWRSDMSVRGQIVHPDAKEGEQRDGWPAGDEVSMSCPHCGHRWVMELPQ